MNRYKVGVIFGSRSTEHEVSVITALQVIDFLSDHHEVVPIYITKEGQWLTGESLGRVDTFKNFDPNNSSLQPVTLCPDPKLKLIVNPLGKGFLGKPKKLDVDVIFPAFHGAHGEDGTIQGLLELADIPYVGTRVLGSTVGIDKIATKAVLKENQIPVLDYCWFTRADWEDDAQTIISKIEAQFSYPVIVKPAGLGSTIGIQKADSSNDLIFAIDGAIHFDKRILIEPYLDQLIEVNCSVLGNNAPKPSLCEQPVSREQFLSYDDKYLHEESDQGMAGATRIIPAPISPEMTEEIQDLAIKSFKSLDCLGLVRADFLIDKATQNIYVNEVNTLPGSISFYLWEPSGISPQELVNTLLDLAFEAHREKRKITYSIPSPLLQKTNLLGLKK